MYQSTEKLPHLLSPSCYHEPAALEAEREMIFRDAWHFVTTRQELSSTGDFVTLEIAGVPVQVRNFNGELSALSNVCAHRHATICSEPCGNSATMRCPYHGWEYQADGTTRKIPQPKNFAPFQRQILRLSRFNVATAGQLVFVCIAPDPQPLREFLGIEMHDLLEERFGDDWQLSMKWRPQYPVNWKIPIENSLEAYHVPQVHPDSFREDPGPDRSEHILLENRTAMSTSLPFSAHSKLDAFFQSCESHFVSWLGWPATAQYWQYHVFPNLLFSFTDAISLATCMLPTSPTGCEAIVRQFGRQPAGCNSKSLVKRLAAQGWARLAASLTRRILAEDGLCFARIQSGLERSPHAGVLGACEERIYQFQKFIVHRTCPAYREACEHA